MKKRSVLVPGILAAASLTLTASLALASPPTQRTDTVGKEIGALGSGIERIRPPAPVDMIEFSFRRILGQEPASIDEYRYVARPADPLVDAIVAALYPGPGVRDD